MQAPSDASAEEERSKRKELKRKRKEEKQERRRQKKAEKRERKRRKKETAALFDDAAEEDEEGEAHAGQKQWEEEAREMQAEIEAQNRRRAEQPIFAEDADAEEQVKQLEARYAQQKSRQKSKSAGASWIPVNRLAELPSIEDPRLFLVKCKAGKEKECVANLMRKIAAFGKKGKPLKVTAVVWACTKGYIYVEANRQADAEDLVRNIRLCTPLSIKLVPLGEMTRALDVQSCSEQLSLRQDAWVRIKRGAYKGDLGKVHTPLERSKALVRLLPRIDLNAIIRRAAGDTTQRKTAVRTQQKLFNRQEVQHTLRKAKLGMLDLGRRRHPVTGSMCDFFQRDFFDEHGYLLKEFKAETMLQTEGVQPALDELRRFR